MHGERLKELRQRAHLSQYKLALKAGLQPGTIRYLEQKERANPKLATLEAIAEALDCTLADLLAEPEQVAG